MPMKNYSEWRQKASASLTIQKYSNEQITFLLKSTARVCVDTLIQEHNYLTGVGWTHAELIDLVKRSNVKDILPAVRHYYDALTRLNFNKAEILAMILQDGAVARLEAVSHYAPQLFVLRYTKSQVLLMAINTDASQVFLTALQCCNELTEPFNREHIVRVAPYLTCFEDIITLKNYSHKLITLGLQLNAIIEIASSQNGLKKLYALIFCYKPLVSLGYSFEKIRDVIYEDGHNKLYTMIPFAIKQDSDIADDSEENPSLKVVLKISTPNVQKLKKSDVSNAHVQKTKTARPKMTLQEKLVKYKITPASYKELFEQLTSSDYSYFSEQANKIITRVSGRSTVKALLEVHSFLIQYLNHRQLTKNSDV